ncbi:MAG TPA: hypothetical protein VNT81_18640 [Vicinamibacterales bacterium]|nr:hypothetical protein [Vicinamibacterales bacterium]
MASVAVDLDRRCEPRRAGSTVRWQSHAVLRPGLRVTVINITSRAALVESEARLRPGAMTELQLSGATTRACVRGRLDRCYVTAIDPLRYRGVVMFDGRLDIDEA